jgi:hypothetical protein
MCPKGAEHFLADILSRRRGAKDLVGDAKDHVVMLVPRGLERPRIALEETFEDLPITAELDYLVVHAYRLRNDAVGAVIADCQVADQFLMGASVNALAAAQDYQTYERFDRRGRPPKTGKKTVGAGRESPGRPTRSPPGPHALTTMGSSRRDSEIRTDCPIESFGHPYG